jgi:hypothetical protein
MGGDVEKQVDRDALKEKLKAMATDGKLECARAMAFAQKEKVPSALVGELCNELKIKFKSCQLGCFP